MVNGGDSQLWPYPMGFMSNHFDELRTARKEGRPLHRSDTSNQKSDRFHELRTARREGRPLHQSNTSKKRDDPTEERHPGPRYRRPTPHHIEPCRDEGVSEPYPKGDSPLADALRGRSRSSPPPRTRAPTPHPRASAPRMTKKTVRWADPLEQPTPRKIGSEEKGRDSETPEKDEEETPEEDQPCTLRRYRPLSIPRPKRSGSEPEVSKPSCSDRRPTPIFTIEVKLASQARQSPQRSLSPLIPQAMPAPLRISPIKTSTRRVAHAIPSSFSAPEVQTKSATRDFSFEGQPEIIILSPDHRRPHQYLVPEPTQEKHSSSQPTAFSYLKEKPRRPGTVRPRPSDAKPASAEPASTMADISKPALQSSSSTSSFHTAKSFWSDMDKSDSKNRDSSSSPKPVSPIKPGQPQGDVTAVFDRVSSSPSKAAASKIPIPSSASSSSFHAVKNFWNGISGSSSCGAIVDGSEDVKPVFGPSAVADRVGVFKTSKVAELSGYTVNKPVNGPVNVRSSITRIPISCSEAGSVGRDVSKSKSKIPVSSTFSYHVTKTQQSRYVPLRAVSGDSASRSSLKPSADPTSSLSGISSSSSYRTAKSHPNNGSNSDASAFASGPKMTSTALTTAILSSNDSARAEDTPSLQSQLWNDVMNLCISESSSCPQYSDCDDCIWSGQEGVDRCSTVARVDDGKCRGR
ncbi:hypothetical protein B0H65DRAFT_561663 [Neurospora tetraspora]|uniref:Uncharacterized protein n=1 Tax=Neurospora tetraspora TaxID=94610 RepID=A0AAE0MJJ8_9PEZI|nr:hypothetical protein B0H65DRAFT_561663 [Neurospora tetraspora]